MLREFLKAAGLILGSSVLAQVAVVAASPILSRLYAPDDFGVLATASGIISILAIGASLRFEEVIPLIQSDRVARLATGFGLVASVLTGLAVAIPVYLFGRGAGIPVEGFVLPAFAVCVAAAVALAGAYSTLTGARLRGQAFPAVARANVERILGQLGIQLAGGLLGGGAIPLLLAKVAEKGIGIRRLWRLDPPATSARTAGRAVRHARPLLRRYRDLVGFGLLAALARGIRIGIVAPVITIYWGVAMAGIFALAYRALVGPFILLGGAALQAFLGVTSGRSISPGGRLSRLVLVATAGWGVATVATFLILHQIGEPLFAWVFGPEWREAGELAPHLAVVGASFAFSLPLQRLYDLWGLVRVRLALEAGYAVAVVATLIWTGGVGTPLVDAMALLAAISALFALLTVAHITRVRPTNLRTPSR